MQFKQTTRTLQNVTTECMCGSSRLCSCLAHDTTLCISGAFGVVDLILVDPSDGAVKFFLRFKPSFPTRLFNHMSTAQFLYLCVFYFMFNVRSCWLSNPSVMEVLKI
jgi:hypothetical protein